MSASHVRREWRWRWLVHVLHGGRRNDWRSNWFCFVCAHRRFTEWRALQDEATDGR